MLHILLAGNPLPQATHWNIISTHLTKYTVFDAVSSFRHKGGALCRITRYPMFLCPPMTVSVGHLVTVGDVNSMEHLSTDTKGHKLHGK